MKLTETILHKAAPYPVVAFDVFDTLIKRDVACPTDLFALLGADFAKARHPGRGRSPVPPKAGK